MSRLLAVLILVATVFSHAQNTCECSKVLEQLIAKVETEYPGFKDKMRDTPAYENFKRQLLESSRGAAGDDCLKILRLYTEYFKDGHLVINRKGAADGAPRTGASRPVDVDIEGFKKYLAGSRDGLEGIWASGGYRVGIKKGAGRYTAFVITSANASWKPKEIKFELAGDGQATYYWGNHAQTADTYAFLKGCLIHFRDANVVFAREFPAPPLTREIIAAETDELEGFYLKPLSDKTLLLRISSFSQENTERIAKLVEDNKLLLAGHENLVIDVRGNGGGTDYSIKPILPYLYTNPVRYPGGEYLVTQTLIDALASWANGADKVKDADEIKQVRSDIRRMEGKIGEFIPYSAGEGFGFSRQDSVLPNPGRVVILADGGCGSTTERLLYEAKQSKKVKVFGTPTYGALDYLVVYEFALDCPDYALYMPTVRLMRLPDYRIDNIGIQPDVFMDKHIGDWVQYAKEYLEN